ncbi:YfhO family protein [Paenibacillus sp. NPDC058174]|uniref:YfhO family protein n=1 Tax=Paenibacillus sp. NPDC058174 TaxID=3346366 RepID=UPI0036DB5331
MSFSKLKSKKIWILIILVLLACTIVYGQFITFSKLYIFNDTGSDTFDAYWPFIYDLNTKIKQGDAPFWSHNMGIGINYYSSNVFIGDPFVYLYMLLDPDYIVYAFGLIMVVKILLSAVFFYLFTRKMGLSSLPSIITSFIYAFNGYIILWGQHYQFVNVMLYAPLLLLGFERLLKDKKGLLITLAVMLLALNSYYFLYIISIFFLIYAVMRYLVVNRFSIKEFSKAFIKAFSYYTLGVTTAFFLVLPAISYVLNSPRISGKATMGVFKLGDLQYYISLVLRAFGNDTTGIANQFYGYINYYESPIIYSSILTLLLLPQIFIQGTRKEKVVYSLVYMLISAMLLLPFFAVFFNAFSKIDYRWTFGIIIFNLYTLAHVLQKWISNSYRLNIKVVITSLALLMIIPFVALYTGRENFDWTTVQVVTSNKAIIVSLVFCILYFLIFLSINKIRKFDNRHKFSWVILAIVFIEAVTLNYPTVNDRMLLDSSYIKNKEGYFDSSNDALNNIKEVDNGFYRINKTFNSRFLNDALIQKYNGFKEYNSVMQPSTIDFYNKMNVTIAGNNSLIYGLDNRVKLETFLNNKYYLSITEQAPYGYKLLGKYNNIYAFENEFWLPFGYTYDSFIKESEFDKLDTMQKEDSLYKAFVVNDDSAENFNEFKSYNSDEIDKPNEEKLELSNELGSMDNRVFTETTFSEPLTGEFVLSLDIDAKQATTMDIYWKNNIDEHLGLNVMKYSIEAGKKNYNIPLNYKQNIIAAGLSFETPAADLQISDAWLSFKKINYNIEDIKKLSQNEYKLSTVTNNKIEGVIEVAGAKLLALSVPYDEGWSVKVDGKEAKVQKVNVGFIGVLLEPGLHQVEFKFTPPLFKTGLIITIISILIIVTLLIIQWRKQRVNQNT